MFLLSPRGCLHHCALRCKAPPFLLKGSLNQNIACLRPSTSPPVPDVVPWLEDVLLLLPRRILLMLDAELFSALRVGMASLTASRVFCLGCAASLD